MSKTHDRSTDGETSLSELAEQKATPTDQVLHLRKAIQKMSANNASLRRQLGEQTELAEMVAAAVVATEPLPRFKYTAARKHNVPIIPVLKLSDWHIGEVVEPKETENFNAFNWDIAQKRIYGIIEDFLRWIAVQRTAYWIDECAIFGEGDYVSGDIHYELQVTNEFPLPEQTAKAGLMLGEVLRMISPHFKRVTVNLVGADNHGRLQKKPQAKQKSSNNMSFLVHTLAMACVEKHKNIRFCVGDGMKLLAEVNGFRILSEHGDTVKGWAGLPYYGFQRIIGKEAKRRMNTEKGFHWWSIGHFHVPSFIEATTLVNGSLSGTSEFDHSQGRHAKPSQLAYLVHPKHGIFNLVPFHGKI